MVRHASMASFLWCLMLGLMVLAGQAVAEPPEAPKKKAPLEIFQSSPLVFGTVLAIRGPSTIILHPNGQREVIGDLDMKPHDVYASGRLAITGERNHQVHVLFDPKIPLLPFQIPPTPKAMPGTVEHIVLFSTKIAKISEVARLNYFGMDTLFVGATLFLSPESPTGAYVLTLEPSLEYRGAKTLRR